MKKIIITLFSFALLTLSTTLFAQQEAHIFIPSLKTDKTSYSQGEVIKTEFEIDNNSTLRQSDVYITTSLVTTINGENVELNIQKHFEDLYLEAESKRILSLEHVVNADINGSAEFVLNAYLKDGSLVGQKRNPVTITNLSAKDIILFDEAYVSVDDVTFPLQAGPTASKDSVVQIEFTTPTLPKEDILVRPKIELYDRTQFSGEPIQTITPSQITLSSNASYFFSLPTDLDPKVYEGVVSFSSNNSVTIPPIYFRYIIEGPIGTILNANTNKLSVSKDEMVSILVEYAGIPPVVENLENFSFENEITSFEEKEIILPDDIDIDSLSDEEIGVLIEKFEQEQISENQSDEQNATIKVSLLNENGEVIGTGTSDISLSDSGKVSIDIQVSEKAKRFTIMSEMVLKDGTVLSTYKTDLPSEKELKDVYLESNIPSWIVALFSVIALVIVLIGVIFARKKLYKHAIVLIIPLLATVGSYTYIQTSDAFTVEFASIANDAAYFKVNAIFSPGPSDSVSYAPGEVFKLSMNASFVACGNSGFTNLLYGPSDDWSNFSISQLDKTFDYQHVLIKRVFRGSSYFSLVHKNIKNDIGDGSGLTLDRFTQWWTSIGELPFVEYKDDTTWTRTNLYQHRGFYQEGIEGLEGRELWRTNTWGTRNARSGNETSTNYNMSPAYTYYMPTEPGFHTFYFMLQNRARGNTSSTRIVSQEVCVRGAGVCKDEVVALCPNLTGTFTKNAQGQILQNGVLPQPALIEDANGNCIPQPPTCNGDYTEGELVCINGQEYTMSCSLTGEWIQNPTGRTCVDPSSISCQTSPRNPALNQDITFTAYPSGATYLWEDNNQTSHSITKSFSSQGTYRESVDITVGGVTETEICTANVGFPLPPLCGDEFDGSERFCPNGEEYRMVCSAAGVWEQELTGELCVPNGGSSITTFRFSPSVADSSGQCNLELEATNIASCQLTNRVGTAIPIPVSPEGVVSITSQPVNIGTWTLTCTGLDGATSAPVSRSCMSNPTFGEF